MKITLAALAIPLLAIGSPAMAASLTEAGRYYQADSAISFGAFVFAATAMMAANVGGRRRQGRPAPAAAPAWRRQVMRELECDLQLFSRQLRRAA